MGGPLGDMLAGRIPQATLQAFQNTAQRTAANLGEGMRGARYGSDVGKAFGRAYTQGLTGLASQAAQNVPAVMGAVGSFASPLLQLEAQRNANAFAAMLQEQAAQTGIDPTMLMLMQLIGSPGGIQQSSKTGEDPWGAVPTALGNMVSGLIQKKWSQTENPG
jgi:hypothetical protein